VRRAPLFALLLGGCGGFHTIGDDGGLDAATDDGPPDFGTPFTIVQEAPDAGALRAVWGSSADDVYVVGDDGVVLHQTGGLLNTIRVGTGADLTSVWGSAANDVWVVGSYRDTGQGLLFHRTKDFFTMYGTTPFALKSVWGVDELRYAVGADGAIYQGDTAAPFSMGTQVGVNPDIPLTPHAPIHWSIHGNSRSNILIAADVDLYHYWDGDLWHSYEDNKVRTRAYRSVFGPPGTGPHLFIGGNYFAIWEFTGPQNPLIQVNEENDKPAKADRSIWALWGPTPGPLEGARIIAVGDEGRIMLYDSMRQLLRTIPSPTRNSLYGIWGASLDDVWIVGEGGLVMRGKITF
jgi:hypothetical protein